MISSLITVYGLLLHRASSSLVSYMVLSRDEATLHKRVSDGPSVTRFFFGLLRATNAVYTALFNF